jgi:hypothetical protein
MNIAKIAKIANIEKYAPTFGRPWPRVAFDEPLNFGNLGNLGNPTCEDRDE